MKHPAKHCLCIVWAALLLFQSGVVFGATSFTASETIKKVEKDIWFALADTMNFELTAADKKAEVGAPTGSGSGWDPSREPNEDGKIELDGCGGSATVTFTYSRGGGDPTDAFEVTISGTFISCNEGTDGEGAPSDFQYTLKKGGITIKPPQPITCVSNAVELTAYLSNPTGGAGNVINNRKYSVEWTSDPAVDGTDVKFLGSAGGGTALSAGDFPRDNVFFWAAEPGEYEITVKPEGAPESEEETVTVTVVSLNFVVESDDSHHSEDNILTDNREATVRISVQGVENTDGFSFGVKANPVEVGSLINNATTDITITSTEDPLVWRTNKIYWYGKLPDKCCYSNYHAYKFEVTLNNEFSISKDYTVKWPKENPRMRPSHSASSDTIIHNPEPVPGIPNWYRCLIEFKDFNKTTELLETPTTDQYSEETTKEEEFHEKQWLGQVSTSLGGQGDCFTAKGIKWAIGWVGMGPWYTFGSTPDEALTLAQQQVNLGEIQEISISSQIWLDDRGFYELKAKEHAGYNAAWKYHCTYEDLWGAAPENNEHPAY